MAVDRIGGLASGEKRLRPSLHRLLAVIVDRFPATVAVQDMLLQHGIRGNICSAGSITSADSSPAPDVAEITGDAGVVMPAVAAFGILLTGGFP